MFADVRTGLSGRESKVRVERGSGSFGQLIVRLGPLRMRWMASFLICMVIAGCGVATQPESARTVAAFEVPLPSEADRNEFLSVLRAAAEVEGMHVDAASKAELEREANVSPNFKMTMKAAVWRGSNDDEGVASAMDLITGAGVWAFMANIHDQQMWLAFVVAVSMPFAALANQWSFLGSNAIYWASLIAGFSTWYWAAYMATGAVARRI
jgi:hypothetical protein